ncbi:MAG: bifunctional glycosyltransferase family 2 protein/CDP-glycerol:glycerophosphate glycerophosphotransferase [Lachnospiraceae bacterium]|nr:bifunctional glycosyltransferase family 2 protein/CDP-glycerol:glycerophosphate glycerophosphotransferase [Lachnospiraceae bacterium]
MSRLTVIIPLVSEPRYLRECLESLARQDIYNIDALIVRDYQSDTIEAEIDEIAKELASKIPIKQIETEDEHGISGARNTGLYNTKSDYVMFMDPDDYLEDGTLKVLLESVPNLPVPLVYVKVKPFNRLASGIHEEYEEELILLNEYDEGRLSKRPIIDQSLSAFDQDTVEYMVGLRDNLEDFTVLGCVFHRSFLKENDILFDNNVFIYPDAPFICKVLLNAESTLPIDKGAYIRRNGRFRYEVEAMCSWKDKVSDYVRCYDKAYSQCTGQLSLLLLIQETMCTKYVNIIIKLIWKSKDREFAEHLYESFKKQIIRVDRRVINSFPKSERKHLKLLQKGNIKESVDYMPKFIKIKKKEHLFKSTSKIKRAIAEKMFSNLDILERCILFESDDGNSYCGDPKYIYMYMQENYPGEYLYVWVANDKELRREIDGKCKKVSKFSFMYYYYTLRAKYWVKDTRQPIWWFKSRDQVFISTWQGTPLQKIFNDNPAYATVDKAMHKGLKAQISQWDCCISGNPFHTEFYKRAMNVKAEQILEVGHPKNDFLQAHNNKEYIDEVKESLSLPLDKKVILYAPTWREEEEVDVIGNYSIQLGLFRIKEQLGDDYVVLLRINKNIIDMTMIDEAYRGFVYNCSRYNDIHELMLVSDILITDYSSIIFDYSVLGRPIYFFAYDFDAFLKLKEHFYLDFENDDEMPGPIVKTTQEIIDDIKEPVLSVQYEDRLKAFSKKYCPYAKGSARRLAKAMFKEMEDIFRYEDEERQ